MPKPIDWHDVALVAFHNGKPVIITSIEPHVIFDMLCSLVVDGEDSSIFGEDDEISREAVMQKIGELDWKLYPVQDAKDVFCGPPRPKQNILPLEETTNQEPAEAQ